MQFIVKHRYWFATGITFLVGGAWHDYGECLPEGLRLTGGGIVLALFLYNLTMALTVSLGDP